MRRSWPTRAVASGKKKFVDTGRKQRSKSVCNSSNIVVLLRIIGTEVFRTEV